jgi:hypothetical protein
MHSYPSGQFYSHFPYHTCFGVMALQADLLMTAAFPPRLFGEPQLLANIGCRRYTSGQPISLRPGAIDE